MHYNGFVEAVHFADNIDPVSSSTQVNGTWTQMTGAAGVAIFHTGLIAATGTLTFQVRQAKDAAGTGAKAFKVAAAMTDTADNNHVIIRFRAEELDVNGGFDYVRIEAVAATAASLISAELYFTDLRNQPAPTTLWAQVV